MERLCNPKTHTHTYICSMVLCASSRSFVRCSLSWKFASRSFWSRLLIVILMRDDVCACRSVWDRMSIRHQDQYQITGLALLWKVAVGGQQTPETDESRCAFAACIVERQWHIFKRGRKAPSIFFIFCFFSFFFHCLVISTLTHVFVPWPPPPIQVLYKAPEQK